MVIHYAFAVAGLFAESKSSISEPTAVAVASTVVLVVVGSAVVGGGAVNAGESAMGASGDGFLSHTAGHKVGSAGGSEEITKPLGFYFQQHAAAVSKHTAYWEAVTRVRGALLRGAEGNGTHPLGFYFGVSSRGQGSAKT